MVLASIFHFGAWLVEALTLSVCPPRPPAVLGHLYAFLHLQTPWNSLPDSEPLVHQRTTTHLALLPSFASFLTRTTETAATKATTAKTAASPAGATRTSTARAVITVFATRTVGTLSLHNVCYGQGHRSKRQE